MKEPNPMRARRNDSSSARARQAGKPLTADGELMREIQRTYGRLRRADLLWMAADLERQAAGLRRATVLLKKNPRAWRLANEPAPSDKSDKPAPEAERVRVVLDLGPEHQPVLDWFRRRHWLGRQKESDASVAWSFCQAAFTVPEAVSRAIDFVVHYRDAEDLNDRDAMRAIIIAGHRRLKQRSNAGAGAS